MISLFILKSNARGMRYGMGTYIKQLTDYLVENKKDLQIFIINYFSDTYRELTVNNKTQRLTEIYIPLPVINLKGEDQVKKYAKCIVSFLIPYLIRYPNPIFQVNYPDALQIVKILKSRFNITLISVIHSAQWQFAFNGNKKKFIEMWTNNINKEELNDIIMKSIEYEKELYELSDKIVSVTKYMKEFIMNYYNIPEKRIEVIHNGIHISNPIEKKSEEKEKIKRSLGFSKSEKIILFSGRLDKGKGLYFLLEAFSEVVNNYYNVRLIIIGEDSGCDKITNYLKSCKGIWGKVTFTGFVEYEFMEMFYHIADIGIIPSLYDHCPYVALEMIQYGIPLIISDIEGLNEIFKRGECLLIKPSYDEEGDIFLSKSDAVNAIIYLLRNLTSYKKGITSNYVELLRTRFACELMGDRMYSLLSACIEK